MAPRNIPVSPHNNRYRTAAAVRFVHRITPPPAKASSTPCQREWINTQQIACIISSIDFAFRTCHHLLPHFFLSISANSSFIFLRSSFDVFSFPNNAIIIFSTEPAYIASINLPNKCPFVPPSSNKG
jgi:hypothetical protein